MDKKYKDLVDALCSSEDGWTNDGKEFFVENRKLITDHAELLRRKKAKEKKTKN
jgi:hypothetical protein